MRAETFAGRLLAALGRSTPAFRRLTMPEPVRYSQHLAALARDTSAFIARPPDSGPPATIPDFRATQRHAEAERRDTVIKMAVDGVSLRKYVLDGIDLHDVRLTRVDFRAASLRAANLRDAAFGSTDFTDADLSDADLSGADLTGARLGRVNLTGANLRGAKLVRAYLSMATLDNADLTAADLTESNLSDANLAHARLVDATMAGAHADFGLNLSGTDLSGTDLSGLGPTSELLMSVLNLDGARWTARTSWPLNLADRVRARSYETSPGTYQILPETDEHAHPVI